MIYSTNCEILFCSQFVNIKILVTIVLNLFGHVKQSESESCYKVIKGSWQQIEDTANKPEGVKLLTKAFKLCK